MPTDCFLLACLKSARCFVIVFLLGSFSTTTLASTLVERCLAPLGFLVGQSKQPARATSQRPDIEGIRYLAPKYHAMKLQRVYDGRLDREAFGGEPIKGKPETHYSVLPVNRAGTPVASSRDFETGWSQFSTHPLGDQAEFQYGGQSCVPLILVRRRIGTEVEEPDSALGGSQETRTMTVRPVFRTIARLPDGLSPNALERLAGTVMALSDHAELLLLRRNLSAQELKSLHDIYASARQEIEKLQKELDALHSREQKKRTPDFFEKRAALEAHQAALEQFFQIEVPPNAGADLLYRPADRQATYALSTRSDLGESRYAFYRACECLVEIINSSPQDPTARITVRPLVRPSWRTPKQWVSTRAEMRAELAKMYFPALSQ